MMLRFLRNLSNTEMASAVLSPRKPAGSSCRAAPQEDLTSALVAAEVDGERLTSAEIASFFILLAVAGNETTRNAISHGVLALNRFPGEYQKLRVHTPVEFYPLYAGMLDKNDPRVKILVARLMDENMFNYGYIGFCWLPFGRVDFEGSS